MTDNNPLKKLTNELNTQKASLIQWTRQINKIELDIGEKTKAIEKSIKDINDIFSDGASDLSQDNIPLPSNDSEAQSFPESHLLG